MPAKNTKKIRVLNLIRSIVFVMLFVEIFVLNIWLVPFYANVIVSAAILTLLPLFYYLPNIRDAIEDQVFDRINLRRQVVEYESGMFGEQWDRPYNEFRIHCQPLNFCLVKIYLIRLKHRVIGNSILKATFSKSAAESAIKNIVNNTQLGFTRGQGR